MHGNLEKESKLKSFIQSFIVLSEQDNILIQKYFDGLLSSSEMKDFNLRLINDKVFKKETEVYRQLNAHLDKKIQSQKGVEALEKFKSNNTSPSKTNTKVYAFLFLCLCLILFSIYFLNRNSKIVFTNDDVYAAHFTPEDISIVTKTIQSDQGIAEAHEAYLKKDYNLAIELFEENETVLSPPSQLAFALSLMQLGQFDRSQRILDMLSKHDVYKTAADWYQSLILIKSDQREKARHKLQNIDSSSSYYKRAQDLLKDL